MLLAPESQFAGSTAMTTPTLDRNRLQAALASLNLSLEAELTQFRCHRLVQSHRPLETPQPSSPGLTVSEPLDTPAPVVTTPIAPAAAPAPVELPSSLSLQSDATAAQSDTDEFIDFDPAELAGLLPQSYTSSAPEAVAPPPQQQTKRPFASTRELLKHARQNNRPWFQQQDRNRSHHFQRWLIVIGVLAGLGGGTLLWLARQETPTVVVNEVPADTSPSAPPSGPNMAAREFPDVNRSTLAQLEPASSPEPSPALSSPSPVVESTPSKVFIEHASNGRYYVLAPYTEPADLAKVQEILPDAFLVGDGAETKIQLGMFEDEASAQAMVNQLRDRL